MDSLQERLVRAGQPGLARTLALIAKGEAKILLVAEEVRLADDRGLEKAIEEFLHARGAEIVRVPGGRRE